MIFCRALALRASKSVTKVIKSLNFEMKFNENINIQAIASTEKLFLFKYSFTITLAPQYKFSFQQVIVLAFSVLKTNNQTRYFNIFPEIKFICPKNNEIGLVSIHSDCIELQDVCFILRSNSIQRISDCSRRIMVSSEEFPECKFPWLEK